MQIDYGEGQADSEGQPAWPSNLISNTHTAVTNPSCFSTPFFARENNFFHLAPFCAFHKIIYSPELNSSGGKSEIQLMLQETFGGHLPCRQFLNSSSENFQCTTSRRIDFCTGGVRSVTLETHLATEAWPAPDSVVSFCPLLQSTPSTDQFLSSVCVPLSYRPEAPQTSTLWQQSLRSPCIPANPHPHPHTDALLSRICSKAAAHSQVPQGYPVQSAGTSRTGMRGAPPAKNESYAACLSAGLRSTPAHAAASAATTPRQAISFRSSSPQAPASTASLSKGAPLR